MDTTIETAFAEEVGLFASRIAQAFSDEMSTSDQAWVVRAPGQLDVMGGIAEYSGSVTLTATTGGAILAAVAKRSDQSIVVDVLGGGGNGQEARTACPLGMFYAGAGRLADPSTFRRRIEGLEPAWAQPVVVALHTMLYREAAPHLGGGLTLVFHSTLPLGADAWTERVTQAAVVAASSTALGLDLEPMRIAELSRHMGSSGDGVSPAACALLGQPDSLMQMRCQPNELIGSFRLPEGVAVIGIDSGYRHPSAERKYADARVATFMGRAFVDRAVRAMGAAWNGYLAQITVSEYVGRFRDWIPTKIKGQAFLDRFGSADSPWAQVDPDAVYKIRSRTEHHIYENDRVHQFAERLSRVARTGQRTALIETGELMYASHWSYGQRCGLGTVATDLLVNRLRQRGSGKGILGARVSGHGAGGVVVALIDDTAEARAAAQEAAEAYQRETGNPTGIIDGSSPGALVTGIRPIS